MVILLPEVCYFSVHKLSSAILFTAAAFLKHYLKSIWPYSITDSIEQGPEQKNEQAPLWSSNLPSGNSTQEAEAGAIL